jgi:deazaflavin-dependent oxidoreductase (nitroreductase family)
MTDRSQHRDPRIKAGPGPRHDAGRQPAGGIFDRELAEPKTRPFPTRLRDGTLIAVLRSPLGRLFQGMTVIGFRGRRSGRSLMTPVECIHEADRLVVFVFRAETKQWWRNVQADPDVTVEVNGHVVPGRAIVHVGDSPETEEDLATYLRHRPRVGRALGLPADRTIDQQALAAAASRAVFVRIELQPSGAG